MVKRVILRLPFTWISLGVLGGVALWTDTVAFSLSFHWLNHFGFAARDLWLGRMERLFTSALVTSGGRVFWEAVVMIAFAVGLAEWLAGSLRTFLTFWGAHLTALLVEGWVIAWPLHEWGNAETRLLAYTRDVGPSAGYFGCLGLASALLRGKWRWSAAIILGGLIVVLFLPAGSVAEQRIKLFADLAHLIAFSVGWASVLLVTPTSVTHDAVGEGADVLRFLRRHHDPPGDHQG